MKVRGVLLFALVAAGYAIGYELAVNWFSAADQGASFFPAAGVTLAALVLVPRARWPIVLAAAATAELSLDLRNETSLLASGGYALANTAEPLVGAALLLATLATQVDLRRTRHLAAFLVFAVVLAPMVGGAIAATTFVYVDDQSGWARFAFEWWSGDGLGVLVVAGALLSLRFVPELPRRRLLEGMLLTVLTVGVTALVFERGWFEFVYLPVALLVVLAFRVGTPGVAVAGALAAFVAAGATAEAQDFWRSVDVSPANRILYLQLALALVVAAVLALAAEIAERERIAVELTRAESERAAAIDLAVLADAERIARSRIERLQALTESLSAAQSVSDVLDAVVVEGVQMAEGDAGFVALPTADSSAFHIRAWRGYAEDAIATWSPVPADVDASVTRAAAARELVVVESPADVGYPPLGTLSVAGEIVDRSAVAAPLLGTSGRLLGVVYIAFRVQRGFTEGDRQMLRTLARQGAQALERALSFEAEQDARRRAQLLESHAARLVGASTPQGVAGATIAGLEAMGITAAWVQLLHGESLELLEAIGVPTANLAEDERYGLDRPTPPAEAARTGTTVVVATGGDLDARFPEAAVGRHRLRFESFVSVPLVAAGGRVLGVLSLGSQEEHWFDESRRELVIGLAEQCGLALERAQLQAEADSSAEDSALLAQLGDALVRPTGARERADALVSTLTRERAALAVVQLLENGHDPHTLAVSSRGRADASVDDATLERVALTAVEQDAPTSEVVGTLELIAVPLRARDRALGVLTLGTRIGERGRMTPELMRRIGIRAALALDNALLYEQERDVSHSLQMGLLGDRPTGTPETSVATAYLPGTAALEVGGDWYDTFPLDEGKLALLVGDVVGHGLEAAVAMGQLRGAVRAVAPLGSPQGVLERLDRFVDTLPEASMATLAYVELDTRDGTMSYACAGHPPPLVVPADGAPRLLWEGRSAPLGSSFLVERTEASDRLEPGDTLVLYTDGLVERRAGGVSYALDLLVEVAGSARGEEPAALIDRVLASMLDSESSQEDDVCVLALARIRASSSDRFVWSFPADPRAVAEMRRELSVWLDGVDVDPERRRDVVLAVSEAAANAAEHAYGFDRERAARVEVWISDGELRAEVRDDGGWREPVVAADRGRGRTIMEGLMRVVAIDGGAQGTVVRMSVPTSNEVPVR